jgi:regulator of cell morphogenesis and NO signaling
MNDLTTQSLAQIVNKDYRAAAILEKHHLDFCCKGKRSLQKACEEAAISVERVLADLGQLAASNDRPPSSPFDHLSLAQLCDYIVNTHHSYVKNEMPAIFQYLSKVVSKHGDKHPELQQVLQLFTAVKTEMEQHMEKEELVLFPRIKDVENRLLSGEQLNLDSTYLLAPIVIMESEHDHAGTALDEIRKLTNDHLPPIGACTTFRLSYNALQAFEADLHHHVHLENNILFPKALKMLAPANQCSLH